MNNTQKNYSSYFNDKQEQVKDQEIINAESENISENENVIVINNDDVTGIVSNDVDANVENDANDNQEVVETDENESEHIENNMETEVKTYQRLLVVPEKLNIREEPNKDSKVITVVKKDDLLTLLESTSIDGFYKVETSDRQNGYCMIDFVELV